MIWAPRSGMDGHSSVFTKDARPFIQIVQAVHNPDQNSLNSGIVHENLSVIYIYLWLCCLPSPAREARWVWMQNNFIRLIRPRVGLGAPIDIFSLAPGRGSSMSLKSSSKYLEKVPMWLFIYSKSFDCGANRIFFCSRGDCKISSLFFNTTNPFVAFSKQSPVNKASDLCFVIMSSNCRFSRHWIRFSGITPGFNSETSRANYFTVAKSWAKIFFQMHLVKMRHIFLTSTSRANLAAVFA
jgi:hypothetical protein